MKRLLVILGLSLVMTAAVGVLPASAHGSCIADASTAIQPDNDVKGVAQSYCTDAHDDTRAIVEVFAKRDGGSWFSYGTFTKITHDSFIASAPFTIFGGCDTNDWAYYTVAKASQRMNGGSWHAMDSETSATKHC